MEANNILQADLLDIIFEGRNKAYGAYDLRSTYPSRIKRSMIGMGAVCFVFITGVLLANSASKETNQPFEVKDVNLSSIADQEEIKPVIEKPKPKPLEVRTIAVTIPKIVPDEEIEHTEVPPEDAIENVQIATRTNDNGVDGDFVQAPLEESTGGGVEFKNNEPDYASEFFTVQKEAQFPGGIDEWIRFLKRNLNTDIPVENGAPIGKYTVIVSFLVDREGNVSEIRAENDPGYGTAEEAIRVIKKSKQWKPAMQNGNNVIYRQKQSITFVVDEG